MGKGKANFNSSVNEYTQLSKKIAARQFAPIYLLMGEEGYFIDELADQLANTILDETEKPFSQIVAYGRDSNYGNIINICRQMPMMGSYQVVILREAQQLDQFDQLSLYTQAPSQSTILIICHKGKSVDKRLSVYKHIQQKGEVFESVRPREYEISGWLSGFVKSKKMQFEPKALEMLVEHLGTDIIKISNELNKLTTSIPIGTTIITPDHVEENIGISKDFNNFELTRAISERNMQRALLIAEHLSQNPRENPLLLTVSTTFSHFQRIFILNYQRWLSRNRAVQMPSDFELSRMLKLPSPFFLQEYQMAANNYPNRKVFLILGILREYDLKSKGINTGSANEKELLRELLLKIFMI